MTENPGHIDILAFSPHPDDVECACGGSLILAAQAGLSTVVADLTEGEMASRGDPEIREKERDAASGILGLRRRISVGFPDTKIGRSGEQLEVVVELLRELRPATVLAPFRADRHPDHTAASVLVREACFFAGVEKFGSGRPHRPSSLFYYMIHQPFQPSFVVDVSAVWEKKMDAVKCYESQFGRGGDYPDTVLNDPRFIRFLESRGIWFGSMTGAEYGEPFCTEGPVALDALPLKSANRDDRALPPYCIYD